MGSSGSTATNHSASAGLGIDVPTSQHSRIHTASSSGITSRSAVSKLSSLPVAGSYDGRLDSRATSRTLCPSRDVSRIKGVSARSARAMEGLLGAEVGEAMVQLDPYTGGSGFVGGQWIEPASITPGGTSRHQRAPSRMLRARSLGVGAAPAGESVRRRGTLMSTSAPPARRAAELKSLLGNSNAKLKSGATVLHPDDPSSLRPRKKRGKGGDSLVLERAKPRARVEVDLALSSDSFVQGQHLSGQLLVRIRQCSKKQSPILLSGGKVRVIGFECIPDDNQRHIFYQCTCPFEDLSYACEQIFSDGPDETDGDGYRRGREGDHILPFEMELPLATGDGVAKGAASVHGGVAVRYIAMVSIKVKDMDTSRCSLAHFYRFCSIWPQLSLQALFSPAPRPLVSTAAKSLFLGGTANRIRLTARLPRLSYLAGQRCYVHIRIVNDTRRTVRGVTIALLRTTTTYRPKAEFQMRGRGAGEDDVDPDACQTNTMVREVAESELEIGERGAKGRASAKGWWTGVGPNEDMEFSHYILIPPDELSMPRSWLLAIDYNLRITVSVSGAAPGFKSDISVMLPLRIASMLSIDPPPSLCLPPEALNVNRYCKALDVASVQTGTDTNPGTLPSYSTQPPSFVGVSEDPGSHYRDHPPYYTSRQNSDEAPPRLRYRDNKHPDRALRPRDRFIVANPNSFNSSPSSLAVSDAIRSTTCEASADPNRAPRAAAMSPSFSFSRPSTLRRSSAESDEGVESILTQNPISRDEDDSAWDGEIDTFADAYTALSPGRHASDRRVRGPRGHGAFGAVQRILHEHGDAAAGGSRVSARDSVNRARQGRRHPRGTPGVPQHETSFARRVREKLAEACAADPRIVLRSKSETSSDAPSRRHSQVRFDKTADGTRASHAGLPRPPSMAGLPPASATLSTFAVHGPRDPPSASSNSKTESVQDSLPSSAVASVNSGARYSLPSSTATSAAASVNRGLGADIRARYGMERKRPQIARAAGSVRERAQLLEERVRVNGAY